MISADGGLNRDAEVRNNKNRRYDPAHGWARLSLSKQQFGPSAIAVHRCACLAEDGTINPRRRSALADA